MNKVALITGAARRKGLGQAIAARLASDSYDILLHDRGATEAQQRASPRMFMCDKAVVSNF